MTPRYKIAHVLPWPTVGGVELATLRIAEALHDSVFTNIAFCLEGSTMVRDRFAERGYSTVAYKAVEPSYRHPKSFLSASFSLAGELKRQKIDLVHCSDLLAAYFAGFAGRLARVPVLCHVRCRYEDISRRDQSFLRAINKFAFVSYDTWRNFTYHVPAWRGTVVYDGIDVAEGEEACGAGISVRHEFGIPDNARIVGMVARVAPAKDYVTLVRAAAQVVAINDNVRFLIVGDNSQVENNRKHYGEVKQLLAASEVARYFIFTGHRDDVSRFISAMDIFVLCSHTEGLPLVILEAMAHAKPVIATEVGGIPEVVRDGSTGLLHPHKDESKLAAHIISLMHDGDRATGLGEAGRRFVTTNFTTERFAADMKNLYREMLCRKSRITHRPSLEVSSKQFEGS